MTPHLPWAVSPSSFLGARPGWPSPARPCPPPHPCWRLWAKGTSGRGAPTLALCGHLQAHREFKCQSEGQAPSVSAGEPPSSPSPPGAWKKGPPGGHPLTNTPEWPPELMELGARGGSTVRGPLSLAGLGVGGGFLHLPPVPRGTDITPGQSRKMRPWTRVGEGFQIGCPHQTQDASFPGQGSPQTAPLCWGSSFPLQPSANPLITRLPACRKFTGNLGLGLGPGPLLLRLRSLLSRPWPLLGFRKVGALLASASPGRLRRAPLLVAHDPLRTPGQPPSLSGFLGDISPALR